MKRSKDDLLAVQVSNRQYVMLTLLVHSGGITLEKMFTLSAVTSGSLARRGYMRWNETLDRFVITPLGLQVREQFKHTDVSRDNITRPLSKYIRVRGGARRRAA